MSSTGGPAFPQDYQHTKVLIDMQQVGDITADQLMRLSKQFFGMTLRDYFAAKAMQGMLSDAEVLKTMSTGKRAAAVELADMAYQMADAMLAARSEQ